MRAKALCAGLALLVVESDRVRGEEVEIGVHPRKLVVLDKLSSTGSAKIAYVAKDCVIDKGAGTDVAQIALRLDLAYPNGAASGAVEIPAGAAGTNTPGWVVNGDTLAKFVNPSAPGGPTEAKVAVIKPGNLVKVVTRGIGLPAFDILAAGPPGLGGGVLASLEITNGANVIHQCSLLVCEHRVLSSGGAKLTCSHAAPDIGCSLRNDGCLVDLDATVHDTCRNLEWEKKDGQDGSPGSGMPDAGNLHDVDNQYSWAGRCSLDPFLQCQPTAAAATACAAQTGGDPACGECGGAGICLTEGITTVWDWLVQLNAAAFDGHADWRIPTTGRDPDPPQARCTTLTGSPPELETIVDLRYPLSYAPPILGPAANGYWSAVTYFNYAAMTLVQHVGGRETSEPGFVRAVRTP